jgi:Tfp pilus assembly protein PilV
VKRQHRKRGVTLAEVLVATAFLGICSAALVDTTTQTAANLARTERRAVALSALRNQMEAMVEKARQSGSAPGKLSTPVKLPDGILATVETNSIMAVNSSNVAQIIGSVQWGESIEGKVFTKSISLEVYARCPDND